MKREPRFVLSMMRSFLLLTLCFTLFVSLANAQEICNNNLDDDGDGLVDCQDGECASKVCEVCDNGVDDDGDGFIDCYDKECSLSGSCSDCFLGNKDCGVPPENPKPLALKLKYKSDPKLTNHAVQLRTGDVDGDGIPEIVTTYRDNSTATKSSLNILRAPVGGGSTKLEVDKSIDLLANGDRATSEDFAMADIDRDGCAEVFMITTTTDGSNYKIIAYDVCTGARKWAAPISFAFYPGTIGLADFNGDGDVELYVRTAIYNAHTGALLGESNIDNDNTGINAGVNKGRGMNSDGSIAVDVHPTPGLELVAGCRIYSVSINKVAQTATVTLVRSRPEYGTRTGRTNSNATSVADFNQDGTLDVLAVGSFNGYDLTTTIFFWDLKTDALKTYTDVTGTGNYLNGWHNGAGRINIADVDGDTLLNAIYVSGKYLYALKEGATSLEVLWKEVVREETSGYTGCTVFDLDGDGRTEIIYRDEDWLYVFMTWPDGTANKYSPIRCPSRTFNEYPIVADMDGDGTTEICITCAVDESLNGMQHTLYSDAEVRVYESANEPWLPARKVWNQHGYFTVNVNDDLTIPRTQQLHHLVYAKNAPCRNNGSSRPMNSFMNQAAYVNQFGCKLYPKPDLEITPVSSSKLIDYTPFTCAADSFQVTYKFTNQGVSSFGNTLQISFYDGDPRKADPLATRLATQSMVVSQLNPGDSITATVKLLNPGKAFDLYISINDDGTTLPLDISQQADHVVECAYENVISARIEPTLVRLVPEVVQDNRTCNSPEGVPSKLDNGSVKASVLLGSLRDSTNFNFYWSKGPTAKPVESIDFAGHTVSELSADVYTAYAIFKNSSCASDTVSVVVREIASSIDASILVEHELDDAENPNGAFRAAVNDTDHDGTGDQESNFDFAWYKANEFLIGDTLATTHTIDQLDAGTYAVLVFDRTTGCYDSANATLNAINLSACPLNPDFAVVPFREDKFIDFTPFNCFADSFQITFKFRNQGAVTFSDALKISFYNGDPRQNFHQSTYLGTKSIFVPGLASGDTTTATLNVKNPGGAFNLFLVINDDGSTSPLNISQQSGRVIECDYNNVISMHIESASVSLAGELIQDDLICSTAPGLPTKAHNGSVRAYVTHGALSDTSSFNFYWSKGAIAKAVESVDFTGHTISGLASGELTVYAIHKNTGCTSDTARLVVDEVVSSVHAHVVLTTELDNAEIPNGALTVMVNDAVGQPNGDVSYAWYEGKAILTGDILSTSQTITDLAAGTYSVLVQDNITGCYDSASATVHLKKNILGAEEGADIKGVSMYPNPGTDGFTIVIENGYVGEVQIQLQSILGNDVLRSFASHKGSQRLAIPVDTRTIRSGVYLVKVSLGNGTLYEKWIKR